MEEFKLYSVSDDYVESVSYTHLRPMSGREER